MPEYLAPGVYVEETSFRPKTIEGVSTTTTGFVGPTRYGPDNGEPELLTSFSAFERIYGGLDPLDFSSGRMHNYVAHSVRAFFENGGRRLYISRVFDPQSANNDGLAAAPPVSAGTNSVTVQARWPGAALNVPVTFTFRATRNALAVEGDDVVVRGARNYDLVLFDTIGSPPASPPGSDGLYWLERYFDEANQQYSYWLRDDSPNNAFTPASSPPPTVGFPLSALHRANLTSAVLRAAFSVRIVTVSVTVGSSGRFDEPQTWDDLSFHPKHQAGLRKLFSAFDAANPDPDFLPSRSSELYVPITMARNNLQDPIGTATALLSQASPTLVATSPPTTTTILDQLANDDSTAAQRTHQILLQTGNDGRRPQPTAYEGREGTGPSIPSTGLRTFEDLEDISIVAAPGSTFGAENGFATEAATILGHLIAHTERMKYRIAVLDSADQQLVSQVREYRGQMDSKYAALYYPWVRILDPITEDELDLPPSGFVAGIYARNDIEHGVHKAPANEVVGLAIGFETMLNKGQQEVLNPEGVNCFRFFEGRGYRLWGARTITSDPEWKYVNLRRYFAFLERSIEKGTQWVVFDNNSEAVWGNVRRTVEDFLFNEWMSGHLMGEKSKEAYFVRCDRSTMTQNDIDNGRLICLVGVAPVRPAEFVIFRIGQKTADATG